VRRLGFGLVSYDYEDIPDDEKAFSPDGKRAAAWYVAGRKQDLYDVETDYHVVVWDVAIRKAVWRRVYGYSTSNPP